MDIRKAFSLISRCRRSASAPSSSKALGSADVPNPKNVVDPNSVEFHVDQLYQALQEQGYKVMATKYASGAFAYSLALCEGMALANYRDYGKIVKEEPMTVFVIGHYMKGSGKKLSDHYVVAVEALAEDIVEDQGVLFPKFVALKEFNEKRGGKDVQAFLKNCLALLRRHMPFLGQWKLSQVED